MVVAIAFTGLQLSTPHAIRIPGHFSGTADHMAWPQGNQRREAAAKLRSLWDAARHANGVQHISPGQAKRRPGSLVGFWEGRPVSGGGNQGCSIR